MTSPGQSTRTTFFPREAYGYVPRVAVRAIRGILSNLIGHIRKAKLRRMTEGEPHKRNRTISCSQNTAYFITSMTILVIGGTGQTGSILSRLLKEANQSILITSRSGTAPGPYKAVKFDWSDEKTFENPFNVDSNIDRVYLVLPAVLDLFTITKPFIDLAVSRGVKRFILLSATQFPPTMDTIYKYLVDIKVDYAVLRPTAFQRTYFLNSN